MEEAVEEVFICTIIASAIVVYGESMKTRKRKRKYWVRDYFRERDQYGAYKLTLEEPCLNDPFFISTICKNEYTRFYNLFKGTLCELMHRHF